jgi:hypothetical protein
MLGHEPKYHTTYTILLALTFWLRFLQGKWRSMRVIEAAPSAAIIAD